MDYITKSADGRRSHVMGIVAVVVMIMVTGPVGPVVDSVRASQSPESLEIVAERPAFAYDELELRVTLWLDKTQDEVYRKGEDLGVGFQTNADAYAVVYRVDTEGVVTVLWPRSSLDDGFVFGGHEYNLPVTGARQLRVSSSQGEAFVEAVVSSYPFDLRRLELDFHHDQRSEKYDFRVAGDPYLAMNEVNYAITGLEDSGDYIVTNFLTYYVHSEVEHPRYLCDQCHFDDDTAYHPYRDTCTLEITVDHSWDNGWWDRYGYYPVYMNPVYVYVDPWTWQPWVNFWYTPYWRCPPVMVCDWYGPVHVWSASSRYRGDAGTIWRDGPGGRPPLAPALSDGSRRKTREYGQVTAMVDTGGRSRGTGARTAGARPGNTYRGKKAIRRPRDRFEREDLSDGNHGLRIHRGGGGGRYADQTRSELRHTAGGKTSSPTTMALRPSVGSVRTRPMNDAATRQRVRSTPNRKPRGDTGREGKIRTVDPRQRGTRIWNANRGNSSGQRSGTVRPNDRSSTSGKGNPVRRSATSPRRGTTNKGDAVHRGGTHSGKTGSTRVRNSGGSGSSGKSADSGSNQRARSTPQRSKDSSSSSGKRGGSSSSGSRSRSGGGGRGTSRSR
ncbi:hypothetical protein DRQ50_10255 [bacterium]|nr:MAG: hypothetical protein DRQ50_10255 [bacterium]